MFSFSLPLFFPADPTPIFSAEPGGRRVSESGLEKLPEERKIDALLGSAQREQGQEIHFASEVQRYHY